METKKSIKILLKKYNLNIEIGEDAKGEFLFTEDEGFYGGDWMDSYTRIGMAEELAAPILAHGIYNSLLSVSNVGVGISFLLMVAFIYFCYKLWKHASKSIQDHIQRDIY